MNQLSHTIRKFNRFELKYLLTLQQAERFKTALQAYLVADEHGNGNGRYPLSSLYYDSPDLRCYREKVDGLKFRRKLRIRLYGDSLTGETPVFVEIKQRLDRVTQKRRIILTYADALRLCNDRQHPANCAPDDRSVLDEIHAFLWQYNLHAASIVRYERQALIGTDYDIGLRVTFDTSLTAQAHPLRLEQPPCGLPMLPVHITIMEIKVNERIPYWLTELVAAHNLQLVRISKYCQSIEAANLAKHNLLQGV
ncbi:MAG: polyphosphate polymerase domain-containing protein [Anaerolineae bacterium]|nr:polyphosphate polymerase domain-containing protein [Anaerolineae bacterium]